LDFETLTNYTNKKYKKLKNNAYFSYSGHGFTHLQLLLVTSAQILQNRLVLQLGRPLTVRPHTLHNVALARQKPLGHLKKVIEVLEALGQAFDLTHLRVVLDLGHERADLRLQIRPREVVVKVREHLPRLVNDRVQPVLRVR